MKLTQVRVRMFQNFIDSEEVDIEPDITCLVGKNESGKTAFLRALYRLDPIFENDEQFTPSEDYPRWLWKRDEKAGKVPDTLPIETIFELEDTDIAAVEEALGAKALASRTIKVSRNYKSALFISIDINETAIATSLAQQIPQPNPFRWVPSDGITLKELRDTLPKRPSPVDVENGGEPKQVAEPETPDLKTYFDASTTVLARVDELLSEKTMPVRIARSILRDRLPTFFYFSDYSTLPSRIALGHLLSAKPDDLSEEERTALALLKLAGGEGADLTAEEYERRVAELEATANEITRQVFEYWSQNKDLRVSFDVDKKIETDANGRPQVVERFLDVRLHDGRHMFTTNFGTRSAGFRWFFSFIAAFSEFEDRQGPVVILLDEPALSLHARAQADFLRFIEERLAEKHQVIYTTHSPFMIDPANLKRVRLVEDRDEVGGKASKDVLTSDKDTVFPLQAALGYDMAQTLFVGTNNLVVEGSSDYIYVTELSRHLETLDRAHLDFASWTVVPVGGASKVPTFVALLGARLDVTVLVDSEGKLNQELTSMIVKGLLDKERLLTVGQVIGETKADLEDLFTPDEYLALYNGAFDAKLTPTELSGKGPIVKQIEQKTKTGFDHLKPAEHLLRNRQGFLASLSKETLSRFEKLFELVAPGQNREAS